ncbi:hypothetical protein ALC60_02573 [Trachymyrmex zeteki]|uniref:Uncharacterized protein n=1 Tax=Mycetomoellerius zeteki TaxID=64791 RepID=A0A151XDK3_9HYME|nr:hypothetical protein ALC60_02573 [Trachymyrmex zeteki]
MFLIISDDLHSLTSKELEYIPKIILLREFENFIHVLWDRLSEHIRADSEAQRYRRDLLNRAINALPFELHIPGYHISRIKGLEKRHWLADILDSGDAIVETLDYEAVETLRNLDDCSTIRCGQHANNCSLQNVFKIFNWWSQRQKEL